MFSCVKDRPRTTYKTCPFTKVSSCSDQVSPYICNAHLKLFGLIAKECNYTDGDNNSSHKIELYCCSLNSLKIPLFKTSANVVSVEEMKAFASEVVSRFPEVDAQEFLSAIACQVGLNAVYPNAVCNLGGWLNDPSTNIITLSSNDLVYTNQSDIPYLHKLLFHHAYPSFTSNKSEPEKYIYQPHTVLLRHDNTTDTFYFELDNKQLVLKSTILPNCVATPLCLAANYNVNMTRPDIRFNPIYTTDCTW